MKENGGTLGQSLKRTEELAKDKGVTFRSANSAGVEDHMTV